MLVDKKKWGRLDRAGCPFHVRGHDTTPFNEWWGLFRLLRWLNRARSGRWLWAYNQRCKYINVRIDTRSGHCVIHDRDGNRITPEQLEYQHKDNTND